jgi:hypothetical protein
MSTFARTAVLAILRQHGLTKSGTAAQQNPRRRPGISNRIAAGSTARRVPRSQTGLNLAAGSGSGF